MNFIYKKAVEYFTKIKLSSNLCPCDSGKTFENCHGLIEEDESVDEDLVENKSFNSLNDLCEIKTNFLDADFWLIRKGTPHKVGAVTKDYSSEYIGVKVKEKAQDLLLPEFLYYAMVNIHNKGYYKPLLKGMTSLVHITIKDVKSIKLSDLFK